MDNFDKTGIYAIINKINGKIYIGSTTVSFKKRWGKHKKDFESNTNNILLQRAYNKYGPRTFKFKIIQFVNDEDLQYIFEIETAWIRYYNSANPEKGYNIVKIGGSTLGYKHREEDKVKMSFPGENNGFYGKKHTEETKNKMKKNHADFNGEGNPFYGKAHTQETRKKISNTHKNKPKLHKRKLTLEQCFEIKRYFLEEKGTKTRKCKELAEVYNVSVNLPGNIYDGNHVYTKELGGAYKDWLKEMEEVK